MMTVEQSCDGGYFTLGGQERLQWEQIFELSPHVSRNQQPEYMRKIVTVDGKSMCEGRLGGVIKEQKEAQDVGVELAQRRMVRVKMGSYLGTRWFRAW